MKEGSKDFYEHKSKTGFREINRKEQSNSQHQHAQVYQQILPPPSILESYEEIAPGITNSLYSLVSKEQAHRHRIEQITLSKEVRTRRLVHTLNIVLAVAIMFFATITLKRFHSPVVASVLCVSGFTFLLYSSYFLSRNHDNKSKKQRKRPRSTGYQHSSRYKKTKR